MKVDIATLQSMAGQCRNEAADTAGRHATLSSSINTSVLDGWTDSQAAVQFSELYEQWRRSAQGVSDALTAWAACSRAWRAPTSSTRPTWRPVSVR